LLYIFFRIQFNLVIFLEVVGPIIDGIAINRDQRYITLNPADTRERVSMVSVATVDDVRHAFDSAYEAFDKWSRLSPHERARVLYRAADLFEQELDSMARLITREMGKTLAESRAEAERVPWILRFYAGLILRQSGRSIPSQVGNGLILAQREPLGVVSVITPWNFPIAIPAWKIVPAIAAGNTVVFKPASLTPTIAYKLVEILYKAGLPKGVVNMVIGPGSTVGREMLTNRHVEAISFTGSHEVGLEVHKAVGGLDRFVRLQLELGGKNAVVVAEDARIDEALDIIVRGAYSLAGQACTATSRVIAHESIYQRLVEALRERVSRIRVGNGLDPNIDMGPLSSIDQKKKVLTYIEIGRGEGATLVHGGRALENGIYQYGYYVEPTIFKDCSKDQRIFQEEIFGPVLCITPYRDLDEAVDLVNSVKYGLVAGIISRDIGRIMRLSRELKVGLVRVNRQTVGVEFQAPFGGVKASGNDIYKEQGEEALDFYTRIKTVYLHW